MAFPRSGVSSFVGLDGEVNVLLLCVRTFEDGGWRLEGRSLEGFKVWPEARESDWQIVNLPVRFGLRLSFRIEMGAGANRIRRGWRDKYTEFDVVSGRFIY